MNGTFGTFNFSAACSGRCARFLRGTIAIFLCVSHWCVLAAPRKREPRYSFQQSSPPPDRQQEITVLDPVKTIDREIAGGQSHFYDFPLAAGQFAHLSLDQRGANLTVLLLDSKQKLLVAFDNEKKRQGQEKIELVAGSSTTYRLVIKPTYLGAPSSRYQLKVLAIRAANDTDRALFETRQLAAQADALYDESKYDESIQIGTQALAEAEKTAQEDELIVGHILLQLGKSSRLKGAADKAQAFFERAIDIYRKELGEEDPQTALAIGDLGLAYDTRHEFNEAANYYQKAIDITDRALGPDDPQSAIFLMDLAITLSQRGNYDSAIALYQRALAISEKMLGPDDQFTMKVCYNLGDTYIDLHRDDESEVMMKRALGIVERKYGPDHASAAYPLQNLGIIARRRNWL